MAEGATPGGVVPVLTRYGLSPDADLVFRTLHDTAAMSGAELRLRLGLTATRVAEACEQLSTAGAVRPVTSAEGGRGRTWRAVPPAEFLPALRHRHLTGEYVRAVARQHDQTRTGHGAVLLAAGLTAD